VRGDERHVIGDDLIDTFLVQADTVRSDGCVSSSPFRLSFPA
jgi:hypothetical protein